MLTVRQRLSASAATGTPGAPGAFGASSAPGASRTATASPAAERLVLPFELRQKSRLRARLASGLEVGLFLERGIVLRGGDLLLADDGTVVEVIAALEAVSTVRDSDATRLARAAYHLGNRHVPVEIGKGWLRYGHDHVLDDMVRGMGLSVVAEQAPFEPEAGAYGHSHGHDGDHGHAHGHDQAYGHSHAAPDSYDAGHAPGRGFGVLLDRKRDDHNH